ncbi:MAG: NUDIX hydrolase [Rhodospirillales bacterium]
MMRPRPVEQSCVIPYRTAETGVEFALITSRNTGRWIVPKGTVEPNMTSAASAAKEALEEAGLLGETDPQPIGEYFYSKFGRVYRVEIFSFRVTKQLDEWDEKHFRTREWVGAEDALSRITETAVQDAIRLLAGIGGQSGGPE